MKGSQQEQFMDFEWIEPNKVLLALSDKQIKLYDNDFYTSSLRESYYESEHFDKIIRPYATI